MPLPARGSSQSKKGHLLNTAAKTPPLLFQGCQEPEIVRRWPVQNVCRNMSRYHPNRSSNSEHPPN
eukprot:4470639-Karenia_brevis.AAC.1